MKIFIDFDDVIFNTRLFKADFEEIFSQFGITADVFSENYYNYPPNREDFPVKTYILEKHLEKIERVISFARPILERNIKIFLEDTQKYVFSDVKDFLKNFSSSELFLISHGQQDFQRKKIKSTKLESYFSAIMISSDQKSQAICPWIKEGKEKKFFLDDRTLYIEEVKKCFPQITAILIQRPEGRYHDLKNRYCDFTAENLKEALKIISKFKEEQ